jgi:xylulokinase
MGIVDDGQVSVTIGTSGVVFAARDAHRPDTDARLHAFCHAAPGRWHQMGVMLSAGGSLRWFRDVVAPDTVDEARRRGVDAYDVIMERAATAPAGCDGLTFLPYLTGERTPHADAHARGAFVGLTLRHTSAHLARAVLEGITFGLRDSLDLVRATGVEPVLLTLAGGGARGAFWRQLCADVLGRPVVAAGVADAGALGAARLAAVGANLHATIVDACRAMSSAGGANPPGEATARTNPSPSDELAEALERYRSLYPALAPSFRPPPHMVK